MCGRARCVLSDETISTCSKVSKSEFKNSKAYEPMENMTPGKFFPVLYKDPSSGKRCLQFMVWGLIPSHTNAATSDRLDFFKMFNARLETIDEKQSYRKIVKTNRCAVLLSGYFEWKIAKDTGRKQPYYICRKDGNPLCLAAIYDVFKVLNCKCCVRSLTCNVLGKRRNLHFFNSYSGFIIVIRKKVERFA